MLRRDPRLPWGAPPDRRARSAGRQRARRAYQRRFAASLFWTVAAVQFSALAADRLTQRPVDAAGGGGTLPRVLRSRRHRRRRPIAPDLVPRPPAFARRSSSRPRRRRVAGTRPGVEAEARTIRTQIQNTWRDAVVDTGLGDLTGAGGDRPAARTEAR